MEVLGLLSVLTAVLLSAAGGSAQHPKPCTVPPLMSGGFTLMSSTGLFESTGEMSYDAFAQRAWVRNMDLKGNYSVTDLLMLFKEKVYYEVNWSEVTCKKRALDASFSPIHVPSDAKLMGQVVMGSSSSWGMGVLVNTWYGDLPNGMYTSVFTEVGCIPVNMASLTPDGWYTVSTFNWVLGNSNPMEFIPPKMCDMAQLDRSAEADSFVTAVRSLTK